MSVIVWFKNGVLMPEIRLISGAGNPLYLKAVLRNKNPSFLA